MPATYNDNVGMLGFFPWADAPLRNDWVTGDDTTYPDGTFPELDGMYAEKELIDYRVDRHMTSETDYAGWRMPMAKTRLTWAWRAFKKDPQVEDPSGYWEDTWGSEGGASDANPQYLGLSFGPKKHIVTKVVLHSWNIANSNRSPKRAMLQTWNDASQDWDDVCAVNDMQFHEVRTAIIPEDKQTETSQIRLLIFEGNVSNSICISRMRIFGKGVCAPYVKGFDLDGPRVIPGMTQCCFRTGKHA